MSHAQTAHHYQGGLNQVEVTQFEYYMALYLNIQPYLFEVFILGARGGEKRFCKSGICALRVGSNKVKVGGGFS